MHSSPSSCTIHGYLPLPIAHIPLPPQFCSTSFSKVASQFLLLSNVSTMRWLHLLLPRSIQKSLTIRISTSDLDKSSLRSFTPRDCKLYRRRYFHPTAISFLFPPSSMSSKTIFNTSPHQISTSQLSRSHTRWRSLLLRSFQFSCCANDSLEPSGLPWFSWLSVLVLFRSNPLQHLLHLTTPTSLSAMNVSCDRRFRFLMSPSCPRKEWCILSGDSSLLHLHAWPQVLRVCTLNLSSNRLLGPAHLICGWGIPSCPCSPLSLRWYPLSSTLRGRMAWVTFQKWCLASTTSTDGRLVQYWLRLLVDWLLRWSSDIATISCAFSVLVSLPFANGRLQERICYVSFHHYLLPCLSRSLLLPHHS